MSSDGRSTSVPADAAVEGERSRRRMRTPRLFLALRPYSQLVRTLAVDCLWRFRVLVAAIVVTGAIAVALQAGALGLALQYGGFLEEDRTVRLLGRTVVARDSAFLLMLYAGAVATLLMLAGALLYFSQTRSLKLRRRYELFCSERVLRLISENPAVQTAETPLLHDRIVIRLARRDSRFCGRVAEYLVAAIVPAITFLVILVTLFVIQPALTGALLLLVGGSLFFQHRASVRGARASVVMEETSPAVSRSYRQVVRWMSGARFETPSANWLGEGLLGRPEVVRHFDAYEGRIRLSETTRFISNLVFAAALFTILVVFGLSIIRSGSGFHLLVVYLVALRKAMRDIGVVMQQASALNRFYPMVRRYHTFVEDARGDASDPLDLPCSVKVKRGKALPDSERELQLETGSCLAVYGPVGLTGYSLAAVVRSLVPREQCASTHAAVTFATGNYDPLPGEPLGRSLGLGDLSTDAVIHELEELGVSPDMSGSIPPLGEEIDTRTWRRVRRSLRFGLALRVAKASTCPILAVAVDDVLALPADNRWRFFEAFHDRLILVVYGFEQTQQVGQSGESGVAVIDGKHLLGAGSIEWFRVVQAEAELAVREGPLSDMIEVAAMHEDLEDEEEDDDL